MIPDGRSLRPFGGRRTALTLRPDVGPFRLASRFAVSLLAGGADDCGSFACSNDDLNAVQSNARWGLRSNAHSVPTDCPQRDERQGFSGDAHLAAAARAYNFDVGRFHGKFARDHADAQSVRGSIPAVVPNGDQPGLTDPTWTYSFLALPWTTYLHDASARQLREQYERLRRYVDFWHEAAADGDASDDGDATRDDALLDDRYAEYGDWVALENLDGRRGEPCDLFTNAYHYRATALLAEIADALDCPGDAARYRGRADAVAAAFTERYFDTERASYGETQAANVVPLALGLVPEGREADVAATLASRVRDADGHLRTGFLGTPALLSALTENGYADLAYEVVSVADYPGWVYMVRRGATTVWERWDTDERVDTADGMNSRNHSPFALVSAWFYEAVAGVELTAALARECRVDVTPGRVAAPDWAAATVGTPHGPVETRWERDGDTLDVTVAVPWNLTAAVHLPEGALTVDGEAARDAPGVRSVTATERGRTVVLTSGEHGVRVVPAAE